MAEEEQDWPDGTRGRPGLARFRPDQQFELLAARGMTGGWVVLEGPEEWRTAEREWNEDLGEILEEASRRIERFREDGDAHEPEIATAPGLYRLRLAFRFEPGFFEGYPAPGESDWSFEPLAITRADAGRSAGLMEAARLVSEMMADNSTMLSDIPARLRALAGTGGDAEAKAAGEEAIANLRTLADLFTSFGWKGEGIDALLPWLRSRLIASRVWTADERQRYGDATICQPCTCKERPRGGAYDDPFAHGVACAWRLQMERIYRQWKAREEAR